MLATRTLLLCCCLLAGISTDLPGQLAMTNDPGKHLEYGRRYLENKNYQLAEQEFLRGLRSPELTPGEEDQLNVLLAEVRSALRRAKEEKLVDIDKKVRFVRELRQREASAVVDIMAGGGSANQAASADPTLTRVNRLARNNGRRAFAYRLITLAALERAQMRYEHALTLSLLGLRYADTETAALAKQTFYEVVRDSFTTRINLRNRPSAVSYQEGVVTILKSDSLLRYSIDDGRRHFAFAPASKILYEEADLLVFLSERTLFSWRPGWQAPRSLAGKAAAGGTVLPLDNERLLIGTPAGELVVISRDGRVVETLAGHTGKVFQLEGSESSLLSRGADGCLKGWNKLREATSICDPAGGYLYSFIQAGQRFAAPSSSGNILVGTMTGGLEKTLRHGTQAVVELALLEKGSGNFLSRSMGNTVRGWTSSGDSLFRVRSNTTIHGFSVDETAGEFAVWNAANEVSFHSLADGRSVTNTVLMAGAIQAIIPTEIDGIYLIRLHDGQLMVLDRKTGDQFSAWTGAQDTNLPLLWSKETKHLIDFDAAGQTLRIMPLPEQILAEMTASGYPEKGLNTALIDNFDLAESLRFFGDK